MKTKTAFAPGARILVRDAEWLVRKVDTTSTGGQALTVVGISELVKDKESIFLTEIDQSIEILDPAKTTLIQDESSAYQASLLYMESLLRQTTPTDEKLYIGHKAAMDLVPYQLDPAIQALDQPRHRILIADAVGLGKTLEAGILMSELMRRGRGKRILVLTTKSMLTQFQKEMWSRFSIPLMRLDSIGIQRIRSRIPTNHNPFYYYDKSIISIDTLKQDVEYRTYLEKAYWDIIVIDEAQNVAERGKSSSLRAKLAKLLAHRSDTLIMLSATPHDGNARSFASIMNMLDETAIANPDDYGRDDIEGLFIRRFKKDIKDQVKKAFKEREIKVKRFAASFAEEQAYETFVDMSFSRIDQRRSAGHLFKTTLEKSLFSSPAACLDSIENRIKRLRQKEEDERREYEEDIQALQHLKAEVKKITPERFSKYQTLLRVITDEEDGLGWTGQDSQDRLVIFTERIPTLDFLAEQLPKDLGLKKEQVAILYGTLADVDQQKIVDDFGSDRSKVRLLIASDVASEGLNLHFLCHKMIHFDIPWSLMLFQQRNGRIDRYGQERTPYIYYLVTESENGKIRGDTRILELLIEKDEQAQKNIGDPATFMSVHSIEKEEEIVARAIEENKTAEEFDSQLTEQQQSAFDPLSLLLGDQKQPAGEQASEATRSMPTLFDDNYSYVKAAIEFITKTEPLQHDLEPDKRQIQITANPDIKYRFKFLPKEIRPDNWCFILSEEQEAIQREIKRSRQDEKTWPRIHYLWELNPIVQWINDKVTTSFGRHEAPVIVLQDHLEPYEVVFIISGLIPNRKGQPVIHRWFGVVFKDGTFQRIEQIDSLFRRTGLNEEQIPNPGRIIDVQPLQALLPLVVEQAKQYMTKERKAFDDRIDPKLNLHLQKLERLQEKKETQLELDFKDSRYTEALKQSRIAEEKRSIKATFDEYIKWIEDTMYTEDNPYIQVIAVLKAGDR